MNGSGLKAFDPGDWRTSGLAMPLLMKRSGLKAFTGSDGLARGLGARFLVKRSGLKAFTGSDGLASGLGARFLVKRSGLKAFTGSVLMGALVIPVGCSAPNWTRQLSQLSARGSETDAAATAPGPAWIPVVSTEPLSESSSDHPTGVDPATSPADAAAESTVRQIALSSWGKPADDQVVALRASGDSIVADRSEPTLATLVVQTQSDSGFEMVPPATDAPDYSPPIVMAGAGEPAEQPISLASALAITSGQNPEVNFARQRVVEAFANLEAAEVLWLPSLRAGGNYNKHEGRIQDVVGDIIETSRGSIYTGLGAQAVGAGSPAVPGLLMDFHVRDALFQPQIASQTLGARRQGSRAVTNDLMLEAAVAYIDLLEAMQIRAVAQQTLIEAELLAGTTVAFAQSGQGLQADADRSRAEVSFRQVDIRRADEAIRLASIRLARILRADQGATLVPVEPVLIPIEMVNIDQPLPQLISAGLINRPELAEARYLVGEAVQRYRRERYAPLVPSVLLGLSYGGNGGGTGGDIDRFGDRMDLDLAAFWEIRNLGWGEKAARDATGSRLEQARWRQLQQMDQVAADVAEAQAEVTARRDQLPMAQTAISAAEDSYRRNSERIRDGQGLPIEVLQSIQSLDEARRRYTTIVADYNRSQFRLQRALGWPVDAIDVPMQGL